MASAHGFTSIIIPQIYSKFTGNYSPRVSIAVCSTKNPNFATARRSGAREFGVTKSVELDRYVRSDDEGEMSEELFEAIEELEQMTREPSDVLEAMNDRLSPRELQLVLVYFSQEGRDSWCALEVFEWLKKENRVDEETMELMVSLMCGWVRKLIVEEHEAGDVVNLIADMDCVGLRPGFSMVDKVVDLYWEMGKKDRAILFVEEVVRREIGRAEDREKGSKGGPTGYLAWKMMVDGDYHDAVNIVIRFRDSGLKPEVYSYLIAMTAVVKELNEFAKALRKLKGFSRAGWIAQLDSENVRLFEKYQSELIAKGICLSKWAMQEGGPSFNGMIHERLLAMYICAGCGFEAERQLWAMKMAGKEAEPELYDIVLAICASQKAFRSVSRLSSRIEVASSVQKKKTLSWLLRGYIKGGHFDDAAEIVVKMLDYGLCPEFLDREAVLQGLRKRIRQFGNIDTYLKLCKRLFEENLAGPCLVYLYMKYHKLWMIKMI